MSTTRDVLRQKLVLFYQRYDATKLKGSVIDDLVEYAMAEGLEALNEGLMRKYGDYLDSGSNEYLLEDGYNERDSLLFNIELYYLIHDPTKLTKPDDIAAILDWALYHGVEKLNTKMKQKYQADLFEVNLEQAQDIVAAYYKSRGADKTELEVTQIVNWAAENSFVQLNNKLIDKYGVALGETTELTPEEKLTEKLRHFYHIYDPKKLDDDSIGWTVAWGLKYGEQELNKKLQKRYKANLITVPKTAPVQAKPQPLSDAGIGELSQQLFAPHPPAKPKSKDRKTRARKNEEDMENESREHQEEVQQTSAAREKRKSKKKAVVQYDDDDQDSTIDDEDITKIVEADELKISRIRRLVEIFYGKHDPNRLLEEGVSPIIQYAIVKGEEELNKKLMLKYHEDLNDIEEQYLENKRRLRKFYEMYDPSKLETEQFEIVLGRATINGITWLNTKLMKKYDDDTDFTGLKTRIRLFYEKVKSPKTEIQIGNITDWALQKGIPRLNKKMKKKYGLSLEDVYLGEASVNEEEEEVEQYQDDDDDDDVESQDLEADDREEMEEELHLATVGSERTIEAFVVSEEHEGVLDEINFELDDEEEDDGHQRPGRSSFLDIEEEQMEESKKLDQLSNNLVAKIQTFYKKHNPEYGAELKNIKDDVFFVLQNGVDEFNRRLMEEYGESLRSILGRKQTLAAFKVEKKRGGSRAPKKKKKTRAQEVRERAQSKISQMTNENTDIHDLV